MKKKIYIVTKHSINTEVYNNLDISILKEYKEKNDGIIIVDKELRDNIEYKGNIIFINNNYIENYLNYMNKKDIINYPLHTFVMGEMLFGLNHFILNILQPILLELEMIKDYSDSKEDDVNMIIKNVEYLINIIQKLRALKQKHENEIANINIKELVYDYFSIIKDFLNVHNIQTDIEISDDLVNVQIYIGILENLFLEIIMYIYHLNSNFEGETRDLFRIRVFKEQFIRIVFTREFIGSGEINEDDINAIYFEEIIKNINIINGDFELIRNKNIVEFVLKIPINTGRQHE